MVVRRVLWYFLWIGDKKGVLAEMTISGKTWVTILLRGGLGGISGALVSLSIFVLTTKLDDTRGGMFVIVLAAGCCGVGMWKAVHLFNLWGLGGLTILSYVLAEMSVYTVKVHSSRPIIVNVIALLGLALGIAALIVINLWLIRDQNYTAISQDAEKRPWFHQWRWGKGRELTFMICCLGLIILITPHLYTLKTEVLRLETAIRNCDVTTVTTLLSQGIDVNIRHWYLDNTPLHKASQYGCIPIITLLLKQGADVTITNGGRGEIPLHKAAYSCSVPAIELLLTYGSDVHAKDSSGNTPLHQAAYHCCVSGAKILLAHGAKVNAKNDRGKTPLKVAMDRSDTTLHKEDVIELLRQYGAKE